MPLSRRRLMPPQHSSPFWSTYSDSVFHFHSVSPHKSPPTTWLSLVTSLPFSPWRLLLATYSVRGLVNISATDRL
ncbi:hypothetical protein GBAR_LOCUS9518 [Geodia barretti]|uniref:Uncharacterized protein n=1 Tax=Geodia barretti TaxID=519541 RepID=A0AA35RPH6_GEOBA|nr:hypothetical protein GBAR_LOCUS9518 [Geodia barretti]